MEKISILNDVIGPIMRGPSSSHTAASYRIGRIARSLFNEELISANIIFDPNGSYGRVYHGQSSDRAFVTGLMGWDITDSRFISSLEIAARKGFHFLFAVESIPKADHPNTVSLHLKSKSGKVMRILAKSVGGGAIEVTQLNDWPILLNGHYHEILAEASKDQKNLIKNILGKGSDSVAKMKVRSIGDRILVHISRSKPLSNEQQKKLKELSGIEIWKADPLMHVVSGETIFNSAEEMISLAADKKYSLGQMGLEYESRILCLKKADVLNEIEKRLNIMINAVKQGFDSSALHMQLLEPTASKIMQAEADGRLTGGLHTRAAARALAAQHTTASTGVTCAAPTGGSAGTIPGVLLTLLEDLKITKEKVLFGLMAAGAIGVIVARRATFAAEVAGCQVEIGAAEAMASAAIIEVHGGNVQQACDAAAISFQNNMGLVCDLVQGICEIPCHTRNAAAAASAFVNADLILGSYKNTIPLDETLDAVMEVGKTMPMELRVTSLGGLAVCPSALRLKKKNER
jgi:L-serine dehydratase